MAILQRQRERRLAQCVLHRHVRALVQEIFHCGSVAKHRGKDQGRVAGLAGEINGQGSLLKEQLGNAGAARKDGGGERGEDLLVVVAGAGWVQLFDEPFL